MHIINEASIAFIQLASLVYFITQSRINNNQPQSGPAFFLLYFQPKKAKRDLDIPVAAMNRITLHTKKNVDKTQYEIHFLATMTHKEINDQLQVHMLNEKKIE